MQEIIQTEFTTDAQNCVLLLQGLISKISKVPLNTLVKVFKGSKEKDILQKNFHVMPLYGSGSKFSLTESTNLILYLISKNVLEESIAVGGRSSFLSPGLNTQALIQNQLPIITCLKR